MRNKLSAGLLALALLCGVGVLAAGQASPAITTSGVIYLQKVLGPLSLAIGTGTATATAGGILFTSTTSASTTDLLEDTLITFTLPANTLAVNGRGVRITVWGSLAADANSKTLRLYFGSTVLVVQTNTSSGVAWKASGLVFRSGAATQVGEADIVIGGYSAAAHTQTIPTETLSGAVIIKLTGAGATAIGDVTALGMVIEAL